MSKVHIELKLTLNFYNGMFIGGGKGSGLIDSFVIKDHKNRPYIPASTIKGRIRYNYALLLNSFPKLGEFCNFNGKNDEKNHQCKCEVCTVFGGEGNNPGLLYFDDLKMDNDLEESKYLYSVRTGILVNRYNKQVKDEALFKFETSAIGEEQQFTGCIEGYLQDKDYKKQLLLIYTAIKMIKTLGGNQSRGLGWLGDRCSIKVIVNDKEIQEDVLKKWGEALEV